MAAHLERAIDPLAYGGPLRPRMDLHVEANELEEQPFKLPQREPAGLAAEPSPPG